MEAIIVNFSEFARDNICDAILGGHWMCNGDNSGEEYFEKYFQYQFKDAIEKDMAIKFTAKYTYGVPPSFINTLIGLAVETFGIDEVEKRIEGFVEEDDTHYNELIKSTIEFYKDKPKSFKDERNLKFCKRYNKE